MDPTAHTGARAHTSTQGLTSLRVCYNVLFPGAHSSSYLTFS